MGDNPGMKNTAEPVNPAHHPTLRKPRFPVIRGDGAGLLTRLFGVPFGVLLGVLLSAALWTSGVHAQPAAPVSTDAVIEQSFTQTVPIIGRLTAKQSGVVAARIAGTLAAMRVQVGDRVVRGQVLATIDTAVLELRLTLAEARHTEAGARLTTAKAELALADQEVKRLRGLTDSAAVSKADYDDAQQRHIIALARVREASAAIDSSAAQVGLAKIDLAYAQIKAPFDGTITARLTEVGSYLQRGQGAAQLVSDRQLEVEVDVPYDRLGGVTPGAEVEMQLDNGSVHRATVRAVVPEEDTRTRTRRVRFATDLGDDAGLLAARQSVTVLIPVAARRDIVSLHKDAIVQRGRDKIVFVVVDGQAMLRSVRTGQSSGHRIEVLDGLAPGDLAVVRGNERLQPNQPVVATPLR